MLDEGFAYLGSARQALASATRRTNHNEAVKINSPISSSEHSVSSVNRESLIR